MIMDVAVVAVHVTVAVHVVTMVMHSMLYRVSHTHEVQTRALDQDRRLISTRSYSYARAHQTIAQHNKKVAQWEVWM